MTQRLTRFFIACLAAGAMVAPPAAQAFTMEDGRGNTIPKFDLEEQARQFRTPQLDTSAVAKEGVATPFGTMQFGVQRGGSAFGSPFASPFGSSSGNADRRHYERMFAPPARQHEYD